MMEKRSLPLSKRKTTRFEYGNGSALEGFIRFVHNSIKSYWEVGKAGTQFLYIPSVNKEANIASSCCRQYKMTSGFANDLAARSSTQRFWFLTDGNHSPARN